MTKEIKQVVLHHFKDKGEIVLNNDYPLIECLCYLRKTNPEGLNIGFSIRITSSFGFEPSMGGYKYKYEWVSGDYETYIDRGLLPGDYLFLTPKPPEEVEIEMGFTGTPQLSPPEKRSVPPSEHLNVLNYVFSKALDGVGRRFKETRHLVGGTNAYADATNKWEAEIRNTHKYLLKLLENAAIEYGKQ